MSDSEEYPTEPPRTQKAQKAGRPQSGHTGAPEEAAHAPSLAVPLQFDALDEAQRSAPSSGMRVRVHGSALTPTRSPRSGKPREGQQQTPTRWDEPGARTPSFTGTPRVHTRTGSSVSANNMVEIEPDPEMISYVEQQAEHSARMAVELSLQDVLCLEDEESTDRVLFASAEAGDRRKMRKNFVRGLAALEGRELSSAYSSLPPTPPPERVSADHAAALPEDDVPVQREATMEPDAARPVAFYGATGARTVDGSGNAPLVPRPHSGTRASVPVPMAPSRSESSVSSTSPAFAAANHTHTHHGHNSNNKNSVEAQREALRRERQRTSRFFWPLNVAPVYVPRADADHRQTCDTRALAGEEDDEDWLYPYVDTHYYCYSLDAEMAALREMQIEEAVEKAEEEDQRQREAAAASVTSTTGAARRGGGGGHGDEDIASKGYAALMPRTSADRPSSAPPEMSPRERNWRYHQRYQIARLQRLWSTTVLRQHLLFSLSTLLFTSLFVQNTMQGAMNIFEAAINEGWNAGSGMFYSSNNRFGRTVMLTATSFCATALTMWAVAVKQMCCGVSSNVEDAEGELVARSHRSGDDLFGGDFSATGDLEGEMNMSDVADDDEGDAARDGEVADTSGLHPSAMLLMGVITCAAGSISIYGGARNSSMAVAVFGEALHGVGFVLSLSGLLALTLAEVGLQAALSVQLNVIGLSWLITNSAALLIFPVLNRYWLTTAAVLQSGVGASIGAVLFAVCIVLLVPTDVVARSRRPYRRLCAPRAVMRALTNVSLGFLLRTLTFSCVLALVVLLTSSATALLVTVPTDFDTRKKGGAGAGSEASSDGAFAGFYPGPSLQPDDVRRWMAFMFLVGSFLWVLMVIPRVAAVSARTWLIGLVVLVMTVFWCAYSVLTPPLPTDRWGDTVDDGTNDDAAPSTDKSKSTGRNRHDNNGGTSSAADVVESWLLRECFHPSVCLSLTAVSLAIVGTSLVRAIANAGVTLPVVPLCYHEGNRRHRDHHRRQSVNQAGPTATPVRSPVSETTALLGGRADKAAMAPPLTTTSPAPVPLEVAVEGLVKSAPLIQFQRCGGATAMLVLSTLVALISTLIVGIVLAVATWRLSYRAAHPVNPSRMGATSIPVDAHDVIHQCVGGLVVVIAACEVVELVYAFIRARRFRKIHEALHHHE